MRTRTARIAPEACSGWPREPMPAAHATVPKKAAAESSTVRAHSQHPRIIAARAEGRAVLDAGGQVPRRSEKKGLRSSGQFQRPAGEDGRLGGGGEVGGLGKGVPTGEFCEGGELGGDPKAAVPGLVTAIASRT